MASDYNIMEEDLKNLVVKLKRDLHMREVRKLARKHYGVAKTGVQNKRITHLRKQFSELEPTVSRVYSAQHFVKDTQIKGYLIYLLQMKEYFAREVKTKTEIIKNRDDQIKCLVVKLCNMRNEFAKKRKSFPNKSAEFVRLENMSNRMNQIEKRVCTLQVENRDWRENILKMQKFLKQYKKLEKEFLSKIEEMAQAAQMHLDSSVISYEQRENFVYKTGLFKERLEQDLQKVSVNEHMLNLIMKKTETFEEFEILQKTERRDKRIAIAEDNIRTGATGLEPNVEKRKGVYEDISKATGQDTPEGMKKYFDVTDFKTHSMFSSLEELLEEINHTQNTIDELEKKNQDLLRSMSTTERKLRWKIRENQGKLNLVRVEAEKAEIYRNQSRDELDTLLFYVWQIYKKSGLTEPEFENGIDDANAEAIEAKLENQILEYLMLNQYLLMKEISTDEDKISVLEKEEETPVIEEQPEIEFLDLIQPRALKSKEDLSSLSEIMKSKKVLPMEHLKQAAFSAVAEIEKETEEKYQEEDK